MQTHLSFLEHLEVVVTGVVNVALLDCNESW